MNSKTAPWIVLAIVIGLALAVGVTGCQSSSNGGSQVIVVHHYHHTVQQRTTIRRTIILRGRRH